MLEHVVAAEQEGTQRGTYLGLGHARIRVPKLVNRSFAVSQTRLCLVEISVLNAGAVLETSEIRSVLPRKNFEQRGFSAAVSADEEHALTLFNVDIYIAEQPFAVKTQRNIVGFEHVVSAAIGAFKAEMQRIRSILGLLKVRGYAVDLFLLACDGHVIVRLIPAFLLVDNSLDPAYLPHLRFVFLAAAFKILRFQLKESRVIALIITNVAVFKFDRAVRDLIQEITVVGNYDICAAVVVKEFFEPLNRLNIKVVCRLVQEQQVGIRKQQLC